MLSTAQGSQHYLVNSVAIQDLRVELGQVYVQVLFTPQYWIRIANIDGYLRLVWISKV